MGISLASCGNVSFYLHFIIDNFPPVIRKGATLSLFQTLAWRVRTTRAQPDAALPAPPHLTSLSGVRLRAGLVRSTPPPTRRELPPLPDAKQPTVFTGLVQAWQFLSRPTTLQTSPSLPPATGGLLLARRRASSSSSPTSPSLQPAPTPSPSGPRTPRSSPPATLPLSQSYSQQKPPPSG